MSKWPLLVATVAKVLAQGEGESCKFSPDCQEKQSCQSIADAFCKCNHGRCVTVGLHVSFWVDPNITRDCDEGGYMDCACKYVILYHHRIVHASFFQDGTTNFLSHIICIWHIYSMCPLQSSLTLWFRDDPENCFCVGHHCMKEPWECHTSADCAKLDKCKELEEGRGCSCRDSTCESECATKVG